MKTTSITQHKRSLPMPLWMQGALELLITAVLSFVAVLILLLAVWFAGGFTDASLVGVSQLASQIWLLIHGVPLHLDLPQHGVFAAISGTISLIPLGLTLIPLALCFRSGRRLAQASFEGQFWVPLLAGTATYSIFSLALSLYSSTATIATDAFLAALIPIWVVLLGTIGGAWYESRSLARMIGVNAAEWVGRFSQYSRWTGSYVWAVLCSSLVAFLAFIAAGALLFVGAVLYNWNDILTVYQMLKAGAIGDTAVTLLQLGIVPNLIVWAMAWSAGAGFSIGEGTIANFTETSVGAMPALPVLGALPQPIEPFSYFALIMPLAAGVIAGWWFFRAGENHLDEWLSLKIRFRWITAPISTLCLAVFIGLPTGILAMLVGWFAHGSLGLGRFTHIGPTPWFFGLLTALWIAVGVMVGSMIAPFLEADNSQELARFADNDAERARREKKEQKARRKAERRKRRGAQKAQEEPAVDDAPTEPKEKTRQLTHHNIALPAPHAQNEEDPAPQAETVAAPEKPREAEAQEEATDLSLVEEDAGAGHTADSEEAVQNTSALARGPVIRRPKALKRKRSQQDSQDH